ncbi:MAG: hypothetical protein H7Y08_07425 [Rhizobiaceae bacterium]|nr:hypothetical protein [Rhizobiaceae bacterium]
MIKTLRAFGLAATLATGMAAYAAEPAAAEPLRLTLPDRVVAQLPNAPAAFAGVTLANLRRVAFDDAHRSASDRFRKDVIQIWSASTNSKWYLLPPVLLGAAAEYQVSSVD